MAPSNEKRHKPTLRWVDEDFRLPDEEMRYIIDRAINFAETHSPFEEQYLRSDKPAEGPSIGGSSILDPWENLRRLTRGH